MGPKRSGTTLIEVLATLTILLVIGISAAKMLAQVSRLGSRTQRARLSQAAAQRLADRFRNDIANAKSFRARDTTLTIQLQTTATVIEYDCDHENHWVTRQARREGQLVSADRYAFSDEFLPLPNVEGDLVSLRLERPDHTQPWIIEARKR